MSLGFFQLGRLGGVPVRVHWSVSLVALFFGVILAAQFGLAGGAVVVLAFLASILAHEAGHAVVGRHFGMQPQSMDLMALGGVTRFDREAPTPKADGLTSVAGPAVNLVIGGVAVGFAVALRSDILVSIGLVNLAVAVFNMLPGAPLDGGRVLSAVRWARTGSRYRAAREAGNVAARRPAKQGT